MAVQLDDIIGSKVSDDINRPIEWAVKDKGILSTATSQGIGQAVSCDAVISGITSSLCGLTDER